jgi:hypothetical protein
VFLDDSDSWLGGYPSVGDRLLQRRVVEVVLVGVRIGESSDGVGEHLALAQVPRDGSGVARSRVRASAIPQSCA